MPGIKRRCSFDARFVLVARHVLLAVVRTRGSTPTRARRSSTPGKGSRRRSRSRRGPWRRRWSRLLGHAKEALVKLAALESVHEDFVRIVELRGDARGLILLARVLVGMPTQNKFAVGRADRLFVGSPRHPEHLIPVLVAPTG